MRAFKLPLLALTAVAFAAPAMAQDAAAPAAPQEAAPAAPAAAGPVSDAEVSQFATAVVEVEKINKDASVAPAEKQTQMASAVTSAGLTPERFNSIASTMNTDSALQAKVGAAIQAKGPAAAGAPGTSAPGTAGSPEAAPGTPPQQ
jgi:hypothetical protein